MMTLTQVQISVLGARLRDELAQTETEIESINEQVRSFVMGDQQDLVGVDNHMGDQSDLVYEKERLLSVRDRLTDRRAMVGRAMEKIDDGTYGRCERCGRPIAPERLEALPFATLCISCQEVEDRRREARV